MTASIITDGYLRPRPVPDAVNEAYFSAADRGDLLLQRCLRCGHVQHYPRALCTTCGEETEWITAAGTGIVYTFSIVRQMGSQPFNELVPYVVAMIELPEGPRLMGNILETKVEDVKIGMAVEVVMHRVTDGLAVPFWRPAATAGPARER